MRLALVACIAFMGSSKAVAQTPLANPSVPLYSDGFVLTAATSPDGSTIVGGSFDFINGEPRANIARILADGTLDPVWNPGADGYVASIAIDSSGLVYASGCFSRIGGAARHGFAKLAATGEGSADASWNPDSDGLCGGPVLLDSTETSLFVSGNFQRIGGQDRNLLAKLGTTGAGEADASWNPAPDAAPYLSSPISAMVRDASGAIYVAGYFAHIGGQAIAQLAKLSASGSGSADANWNPAPNCYVHALAFDPSGAGSLFAGGCFDQIGGQLVSGLAKLNTSGGGAALGGWSPNPDGGVDALLLAGSELYVAGSFSHIGNLAANHLARITASGNGSADPAWNPGAGGGPAVLHALALNGVGNIAIGGAFEAVAGQDRIGLAVLDTSGNTVAVQDALRSGHVNALLAQSDGGVIVGGSFRLAGTTVRNNLLRLQSDGTLDPDWNPDPNQEVRTLALGSDGTVYASGYFSVIGGGSSGGLARMSGAGAGTIDSSWKPSFPYARALAVDTLGNVYAATDVQTPDLVKILPSGGIDGTWSPSPDSTVATAVVDSTSNKLYVGGFFHSIGGGTAPYLARLDLGTGSLDPEWLPQMSAPVQSLRLGLGDDLYIGGYYGNAAVGKSSYGLARISRSTATFDADWLPRCRALAFALDYGRNVAYASSCFTDFGRVPLAIPGTDTEGWGAQTDSDIDSPPIAVNAIDGSVIVGGNFHNVNGVARVALAGLPPSAPSLVASERSWLQDFYTAMSGPQWVDAAGWNGAPGSECAWFGVQCLDGHVFSLDLSFNGLSGQLPDFSALGNINEIVLAGNALSGTIPPLDGLSDLRTFNVVSNQLTGSIPPLAALSKLEFFGVDENQLTGSIPSIEGLPRLSRFSASHNALSGALPSFGPALSSFNVAFNALTGSIPPLSGAPLLNAFDVSHNQLTGAIPDLSDNPHLSDFNASYNQLSGTVPAAHPSLAMLNLGHNGLTGSIPALENFPYLYNLDLDDNKLTGSIPALTQTIGVFDVSGNSLGGSLPQLAGLPFLYNFYASHNQLTGGIPSFPQQLIWFDVGSNQLSGEIHLSANSNLFWYDVSNNALVGSIPPLTALPWLSSFVVSNNQLTGGLPELQATNISDFEAGGNRLSGTIPPLPSGMLAFVASDNELTGGLPDLSALPNLGEFDVSGNQLSGTISPFAAANTLQRFAVSRNQLTGSMPSLLPLGYINSIDVSHNHLSGTIPDLGAVSFLREFFADSNELTGPIPSLNYYLEYFSASDNRLDGELPSLYNRPMLQFFDVARNQLGGVIPDLSGLTGLKYFRIGSNRLAGIVPPAPSALVADGSSLCANLLDTTPSMNDAAWNVATGTAPSAWWMTPYAGNRCDDIFTNGF